MDAKITNSNENKANPVNYSTQGFTGDPVFVLKSLAKENGVQFPKMQSFYSLVLVNSCAKFTKQVIL